MVEKPSNKIYYGEYSNRSHIISTPACWRCAPLPPRPGTHAHTHTHGHKHTSECHTALQVFDLNVSPRCLQDTFTALDLKQRTTKHTQNTLRSSNAHFLAVTRCLLYALHYTCLKTRTRTHAHAHMRTHTRSHTHTHTHIHTHTHTPVWSHNPHTPMEMCTHTTPKQARHTCSD